MSTRGSRLLWLIIGVGSLARVVVAFATVGQAYDIGNLRLAGDTFLHQPFEVYDRLNTGGTAGPFVLYGWPYPPGLLPYAGAAVEAANGLGLPFHGVIQLLPIVADAAIAWLVQDFLGRRGASERRRLGAAALVALGPSFAVISGYHGQIDAVAILPAVAALHLWESSGSSRRGLWAGALIGLGASFKAVPIVVVLALLPSSRGARKGIFLVAAAAAVPLAVAAPFLVADGGDVVRALRYAGAPGLGGLSMFVQPGLATAYLTDDFSGDLSGATRALYDSASLVVAAAIAGVALFLVRFRPPAVEAAVLVWLAIYAFNPNFFPQYVVWGLPFFVMAGHLGKVTVLQAALVPVSVLFYGKPWGDDRMAVLYFGIMATVWIGWVVAMFLQGGKIARQSRRARRPARLRGAVG